MPESPTHPSPGRRRLIVLVAVLAAASLAGWRAGTARSGGDSPTVQVVAAVDGDTVDVTLNGRRERVRLLGVDTPESVTPDRPVGCFGPEAAAFTRQWLEGRTVRLQFDRERRDRFGRLLAYVHVDGRRFNDELLAGGYARLLVIPPNGRHARIMLDRELEARSAARGLWGACGTGDRD